MLIVDSVLKKREAENNPVRVALVGAGFMGRALVNQITNATPGMRMVAICNRTQENAERAYREAGIEAFEKVYSGQMLDRIVNAGGYAITDDYRHLCEAASVDVIVEATGQVEYGAHVITYATECKKHMVLLNAEVDATVGPILAHKARQAGIVLTGCDGDQPGVEMNLVRFVEGLGLKPLVCGNIKGLQDPYRNPTTQEGFAKKWGQDAAMVTSFADGTKISFEQALVANATGMTVHKRGMLGRDFTGHVDELTTMYDAAELEAMGGAVDYVVGAKPGPGVYVLATQDDPKQKHYLHYYKLGEGPLYSFYTPYHLCHFEVPTTCARAVLFGDATIAPLGGPVVEVIATAKKDLHAGETLDGLGGYCTYGQAERADITARDRLLPMGIAMDCTLTRDVKKDQVLTYDDIQLPEGRLIDQLRQEQADFFGVDKQNGNTSI